MSENVVSHSNSVFNHESLTFLHLHNYLNISQSRYFQYILQSSADNYLYQGYRLISIKVLSCNKCFWILNYQLYQNFQSPLQNYLNQKKKNKYSISMAQTNQITPIQYEIK